MVDSEEISIVIQGPVDKDMTPQCLASIRSVFPSAQIILSTWKGEVVEGLENFYDDLVLSDDPGMADMYGRNLNRQLVSTKAGMEIADRGYILKIRSDLLLKSNSFLKYYGKYQDDVYHCQKHRMLITNYYTRNPRIFPLVYHPSDWIVFGTSEDVKRYYDIDLAKPHNIIGGGGYSPEQFIFLSYLIKNNENVSWMSLNKMTLDDIKNTERLFAECFVVLNYKRLFNLKFLKYNPNIHFDAFSLVGYRNWYLYYKKYCLNDNSITLRIEYTLYSVISDFLGFGIKMRRRVLVKGK